MDYTHREKNRENRSIFGKNIDRSFVARFFMVLDVDANENIYRCSLKRRPTNGLILQHVTAVSTVSL